MKLRTWGRKPDPRKLAANQKRRQWMIYTAICGGSAGVFMMTVAALALSH
jgi:hypothetical protein